MGMLILKYLLEGLDLQLLTDDICSQHKRLLQINLSYYQSKSPFMRSSVAGSSLISFPLLDTSNQEQIGSKALDGGQEFIAK